MKKSDLLKLFLAICLQTPFHALAQNHKGVDSSRIVKVLTFNIYHGETYYQPDSLPYKSNLDAVAEVINALQPDLVALQEVDFKTNRARGLDLVTELGIRTGMVPLFGRAMPYDGGEYGEGILSRYTFLSTHNYPLSASAGKEPRAAVSAIVQLPSGEKVRFVGTHLDHTTEEERLKQAKEIIAALAGDPIPTIFAGDLNARPGSETMQALFKYWKPSSLDLAPTIPSTNPRAKIDYILYGPSNRWRVLESKVIDERVASDHNPVLSIFELLPPSKSSSKEAAFPKAKAHFSFDGNENSSNTQFKVDKEGNISYTAGLEGQALSFKPTIGQGQLSINSKDLSFDNQQDFALQFWIKSDMSDAQRCIVLSNKTMEDYSLDAQKQVGWALGIAHGTLSLNLGSGERRLTYERDNGAYWPLMDGNWHQVAMNYSSQNQQLSLYYDGKNIAIYHLNDGEDFLFGNTNPIVVGWNEHKASSAILPKITSGAEELQALIDRFHQLSIGTVEPEELEDLVVDPKGYVEGKVTAKKQSLGADTAQFVAALKSMDLKPILDAISALMDNPYTIHQARTFLQVAPLLKIYSLEDGKIKINEAVAEKYTQREKLHSPDFDIDNLAFYDQALSSEAILHSYSNFRKTQKAKAKKKKSLITGVWNIFHGGKHHTLEQDGWDSRKRIVEMIRKEKIDVVMMQETYSSGDFIAAELGYYFATTADWDYLNQGSNISVLSRYPIKEVYVPKGASFNNVGIKIALSENQDIYVMSNWYGMRQFSTVYDYHAARFADTDEIPVLFGGDFNAVPHTDGGESPASEKMLEAGFTDAFRSLYTDVKQFPGITHRNGKRIDQLYYKGKGLQHVSTKVISTWPTVFLPIII